jgi:hypothetical protein
MVGLARDPILTLIALEREFLTWEREHLSATSCLECFNLKRYTDVVACQIERQVMCTSRLVS